VKKELLNAVSLYHTATTSWPVYGDLKMSVKSTSIFINSEASSKVNFTNPEASALVLASDSITTTIYLVYNAELL
jgi:hypothetical protein